MKLSCLQENLNKGLGIVGRAVAARTTLPITSNVLLATDQNRLKLVATNLEIAIVHWIGAKVEEEGSITVPARLLSEFVGSLPNDRIDMELNKKSKSVQLKCARFEARISGMDAEDFPPIPQVEKGVTVKLEREALRQAISRVVFAAATEDSRPILTGVHLELQGDKIAMAAADGFRLAVEKVSLESPVKEPLGVVIPAKSLTELNRLLGDGQEPVSMTVSPTKGQVLFNLGNVQLVSQLVQGTFPNYPQLIPQKYSTKAVVSAAEFLRATKAASIFARDSSGIVRLHVVPGGGEMGVGKITVSARAEEVGENVTEVDAKIEGEEAKIALNSKYLSDVLGVLDKGEVALETTSPSSPGVIRPVGSDGYVHVVMPMFVQW